MYDIRLRELIKWYELDTQNREVSCHSFYIPRTLKSISPVLKGVSKKYASRYYQLTVGYDIVGTCLVRAKANKTLQFWWCGESE